jgi:hypothetical protein
MIHASPNPHPTTNTYEINSPTIHESPPNKSTHPTQMLVPSLAPPSRYAK